MSLRQAPKKAAKPNAVVDLTLKTIAGLKSTSPALLQELLKTAEKYQKSSEALAVIGQSLSECIAKVSSATVACADYSAGINQAAAFLKDAEAKRDAWANAMLSDLIAPLRASLEVDQRDIVTFERNYKKDRETSRSDIEKLEARTKKAGKKTTPEVLKQQISELNEKIKEAETICANRMKEVVLLERKKYATFLDMLLKLYRRHSDSSEEIAGKFKGQDPTWTALVAAASQLPRDVEDMVNKQERTFVQIQGGGAGGDDYRLSYAGPSLSHSNSSSSLSGGYDSYDSYSSYDSYDSSAAGYGGGGGGGYDNSSGGGGYGGGGAQARALYDYASEEPSDLPLTAGDVVTILQDDDGSGWTKGQNAEGRSGIFPTSYIEYI